MKSTLSFLALYFCVSFLAWMLFSLTGISIIQTVLVSILITLLVLTWNVSQGMERFIEMLNKENKGVIGTDNQE